MERLTVIAILSTVMLSVVAVGVLWSNAVGQAREVSLTGCLKAGEKNGDFLLVVNGRDTYHVRPAAAIELAHHLTHKVRITGNTEVIETTMALKATALTMVAEFCGS